MGKQKKYRRKARASGATAFVIKAGLLCCLLLLINAAICQVGVVLLRSVFPGSFEDPRVIQACMFFGPIVLILIQFWVYDKRVDYYAAKTADDDAEAILGPAQESDGSQR